MAATPEAKVKKQIRQVLDALGAYYAMPIGTGYGNSGVPDFLVCYNGAFIGIEAKANGGKPTALQEANMQRIRAAFGHARVVDENNVSGLKDWLCNIKQENE